MPTWEKVFPSLIKTITRHMFKKLAGLNIESKKHQLVSKGSRGECHL